MLKTVRELTLKSCFNDSLEDEKLKKLTKVLREDRYFRTAEQIKNKLALLKDSYLKCNLKDGSKKDAFECPFYNELHDIFKTPVSEEKYEHIQNISSENIDPSSSKFSDHSYNKFNIVSGDKTNNKVTVIPNNETWFPGESVVGKSNTSYNLFVLFSAYFKFSRTVIMWNYLFNKLSLLSHIFIYIKRKTFFFF